MTDMPWFPFYCDRFATSRRTRRMDAEAVGAYTLLLIDEWQNGPLPDDMDELAFTARTDEGVVKKVLAECFTLTADGWVNEPLEEVRAEQEAKRERRKRAGRKGGRAKRQPKEPQEDRSTAQALLKQSSSNIEAVEENREEENRRDIQTTAPAAPAVGEAERETEVPVYTDSELLDLANRKLGLGVLDLPAQIANKRILSDWMYGLEPRKRDDIHAAILGAALMRDADAIGWPSAKPGMPVTLKALVHAETLAYKGDGKVKQTLWFAAIDFYRSQTTDDSRAGGGMRTISDFLPRAV